MTQEKRFNRHCAEFDPSKLNRYGFTETSSGGSTTGGSGDHARAQEQKWFEMLSSWDHYMSSNYNKVRSRCRKGVPHSLRAAAWRALCGGANLQQNNPTTFTELDSQSSSWESTIEKDLHRTYKLHELFAEEGGLGQQEMFRVLKCYSLYNPQVGYCQGMSSIAGMLLMIMPAEQAFWCLVSIMEKYLPGYFSDGLLAIQLDGRVMEALVADLHPDIGKFLEDQGVQATFYAVEWFMCLYTRSLPWSTVLRVWDMFMCEGVKVLIKVGIALIVTAFKSKEARQHCDSFDRAIKYLKYKLPQSLLEEDRFMEEVLSVKVSERRFKEEHLAQLAKLRDLCK